ncbi:MAG TPA: DUF4229 domain-containing protein [Marmoricola sp.]|nr:DUF4229 domain-containing protein [Marmoricola sp.]HNI71242.1 DUF4229 domain-containing protein [Marmoricola sp.]HNJ79131.1 DUF4229 domain-containing protein [Marmoricola sp.]HNN48599.1 DUF4229 domain-containing protein [Marmoricola sp.]HNO39685.1 DUF4229 domain-containing protein [Marmoricola sp.]
MKEVLIYSAARLGLFLACYALMAGVWAIFNGTEGILFVPAVAALILSMLLSFRVLRKQREVLAARVQARAERASSKFDELKSKEDVD